MILFSLPSFAFLRNAVDSRAKTFGVGSGRAGKMLPVSSINCSAVLLPYADSGVKAVRLCSSTRLLCSHPCCTRLQDGMVCVGQCACRNNGPFLLPSLSRGVALKAACG